MSFKSATFLYVDYFTTGFFLFLQSFRLFLPRILIHSRKMCVSYHIHYYIDFILVLDHGSLVAQIGILCRLILHICGMHPVPSKKRVDKDGLHFCQRGQDFEARIDSRARMIVCEFNAGVSAVRTFIYLTWICFHFLVEACIKVWLFLHGNINPFFLGLKCSIN